MIDIVPYVEINGVRTVTDQQIKDIYHKMESDGTLGIVFTSSSMKSPDEFLRIMKLPSNLPVVLFIDNALSGIAWINGIEDNHAFAHFCFFKETWGQVSEDMGRKLIEYWFSFPDGNGGKAFDVIIGRIPSFNAKAIRFVEKIGFKKVGEIPLMERRPDGDRAPATILYCSRSYGQEGRKLQSVG